MNVYAFITFDLFSHRPELAIFIVKIDTVSRLLEEFLFFSWKHFILTTLTQIVNNT